jgi:arginyl-tRNA synthetase
MPSLYESLRAHVGQAVQSLGLEAESTDISFALEQPKDPGHGEFSTNIAMVLSRVLGKPPREVAKSLQPALEGHPALSDISVAGPGFINFKITPAAFLQELTSVDHTYGALNVGKGLKTLVEFVSINPTGPIHVGHGRNAVIGDVLCRLLEKTGFQVYREYLSNDAGNQILSLVLSVHARYRELYGEKAVLPPDGYAGEYIVDIAQSLKDKDGDKWLEIEGKKVLMEGLRAFCVEACLTMIKSDLETLAIQFDNFHSEYEMHRSGDPLAEAVTTLREKGYVYEGTLPPPKGQAVEDYVPTQLTLFKATAFGAEQDKPIYNREGAPTYFGQDIAYHQDKLQRCGGQDKLITVIAAQQQGNFTPLVWALEALTGQKDILQPLYYALVKAVRDGKPVKLSKRAGNIIALKDVLAEVGSDAFRFHMLTRKAESELIFDLGKAVEKSMDNPVFYVQYAHARLASVFRQAEELGVSPAQLSSQATDMKVLETPEARVVGRLLLIYPSVLEKAAVSYEPHRLAFYARELAAALHSWYNAEKFLQRDNMPATHTRLILAQATRYVLADLLGLIGVKAPDSM